jgi:CHASE2 domain-containing sensor protein
MLAICVSHSDLNIFDPLASYCDFTSQVAWIFMTIFVILALVVRRKNYELFLYTHYLAIGTLVTVVSHAWASWYFLMPPMLLWGLDKMLRATRTRSALLLSLDAYDCGVTRGTLIFCTKP